MITSWSAASFSSLILSAATILIIVEKMQLPELCFRPSDSPILPGNVTSWCSIWPQSATIWDLGEVRVCPMHITLTGNHRFLLFY
jgi:hypothetical protein